MEQKNQSEQKTVVMSPMEWGFNVTARITNDIKSVVDGMLSLMAENKKLRDRIVELEKAQAQ